MEKIVVQLRDDRRRDVRWSLACKRKEYAELPTLFDNFFERLKAVVFPLLALSFRILGKDVVCLIYNDIKILCIIVLNLFVVIEFFTKKQRKDLTHVHVHILERNNCDIFPSVNIRNIL